jgi:SAM-dependent methyltransferase
MVISTADKGWLKVPGIRPKGDRTLAEQMMGLAPALEFAKGKSVLDLGCAEGLIGREFALAGAREVLGVELLASHLEVARVACKDAPQMRFVCAHLDDYMAANPEPKPFDVVLALGIIHKLHEPRNILHYAAKSAVSLLCFRAPAKATDGVVVSKHSDRGVNVPKTMRHLGFTEGELIPGVRGEAVQYWWRK